MGERDRQSGVEDEAVPIDACTGANRVQILPLADEDGACKMADLGVVPEGIAFDRGAAGAGRDATAVAKLGLGAEAAIAEQRAGIVTAADGVVARREILEAEQRLGGKLGAQAKSKCHLRDRP